MSVHTPQKRRVSVNTLRKMKTDGIAIAALTAYDYTFAAILDEQGVDVVLVGDTLGMLIQGHDTTIPVTMKDMLYHTRIVSRGLQRALLVMDMPFMSYSDPQRALDNAARALQESGAQMVKLEVGANQIDIVSTLAKQGIPVCAHIGLKPQSIYKLGAYRVQGREPEAAAAMLEEAIMLEQSGADILLLECVPAALAAEITANVVIPVIGIGAGHGCDGQILVLQDLLGITPGKAPVFSKNFMAEAGDIPSAVHLYVQAVKEHSFPAAEHCFE
jgi:3-methyl-2-oxobutanoate hydroxymethyltransferase